MSGARAPLRITSGITLLLEFARPARGKLVLSVVLALAATVLQLAPFFLIFRAVDAIVAGTATRAEVYRLGLAAAACTLGRLILWGRAMFISHAAADEVLHRLRIRMAEHLAHLPLGYFGVQRSGEVKKVMADDVEELGLALAHGIPELVSAVGIWLATTIWLFALDWRMGLASVAVVPLAFALLGRALRDFSTRLEQSHNAKALMNGGIVEFLNNLPAVKTFHRSHQPLVAIREAIDHYAAFEIQWVREFFPLGTAFRNLLIANVVVILPVGLWLRLSQRITITTFLLFCILGIGATLPLLRFYHQGMEFAFMATSGDLIRTVLEGKPLPDSGRRFALREHSVEFRQVSFAYADRTVLHDVSFTSREGQVTALVGPSGAGKTTITRLIARFWDAHDGAVLVGQVDVRHMSVEQLMETVAFVFQDTFLFHDTIEANIRMGKPDATDAEVVGAARAARVHEFVEQLPMGYQTMVGERGVTLSGGERQRVAIARAILKASPIVVLDEATAFADPENEAAIQQAISSLAAGRTLIVVAHRLPTIASADQILVIDEGRIVERGLHAELLARRGLYRRLWDDQVTAERSSLAEAAHRDEESSR